MGCYNIYVYEKSLVDSNLMLFEKNIHARNWNEAVEFAVGCPPDRYVRDDTGTIIGYGDVFVSPTILGTL